MRKKDYQLIAEALKVVGETDMDVWSSDEPGAIWWATVNELITRFKADNPRFNGASFRAAAVPESPETAFRAAFESSAAKLKGAR